MEFYEKELESIDKLIDDLTETANIDGKISKEEQQILDKIMIELGDYRALIFDVIDDGKVTKDELAQMQKFKSKIYEYVHDIAMHDGVLSKEEEGLLHKVKQFVDNTP